MLYDISVSGLNKVIWVPRFVLPTLNSYLQAADCRYYMADLDIGNLFQNFVFHEELKYICKVDLTSNLRFLR